MKRFCSKIVDFIRFNMFSKSSDWHAHIYILQTDVYYDAYNKTMDNIHVHQCHCWCDL